MSQQNLTIGALSTESNCNIPTIRYYEKIGLLPRPERTANGHRHYRSGDLKRLIFIKRCRDFGFPIEQVRGLVELFEDGDRSCIEVRDIAQLHLDAVQIRLEALRQLEVSLTDFVNSCTKACGTGVTRSCAIIEDLSMVESRQLNNVPGSCC